MVNEKNDNVGIIKASVMVTIVVKMVEKVVMMVVVRWFYLSVLRRSAPHPTPPSIALRILLGISLLRSRHPYLRIATFSLSRY